jgi:hypothetical protein
VADPPPYPGAPRWLWLFAIAATTAALMLLVLAHVNGGPHHHLPIVGGLDHDAIHAAEQSAQ